MVVELETSQIEGFTLSKTLVHTITAMTAFSTATNDDTLCNLRKSVSNRAVTFKPRGSQLDRETMDKQQTSFRGFFTLFWISMAFYLLQTAANNWESGGFIVSLSFARMFSQDAIGLILSDGCMVAATFFGVILQKIIARGWIKWRYTGMIIQHSFQIAFLFAPIIWTFYRGWPWVQSGFFVLHTIAMLMKVHSYAFYNGDMSSLTIRLSSLRKQYAQLMGLNKKSDDYGTISTNSDDSEFSSDKSVLDNLTHLREEIDEIEQCLKSPSGKVSYPDNLTFVGFLDYLLIPTLVYELEYPRTEKIRPWYVFEKALATFGTFFLLYVNTQTYIIPVIPHASDSLIKAFFKLSFPFMVNYLLIFYIIFECICNSFAEISRFADRNFYDDWWNSATFEEFARKWNKPVHHFLLRHVYQTSMESYKLSKRDAGFFTFFLSSLIHELVMVVVAKKVRMYLFVLQMLQLPLIYMARMPIMRKQKWLGNTFFWFALFFGPPMLGILYCWDS